MVPKVSPMALAMKFAENTSVKLDNGDRGVVLRIVDSEHIAVRLRDKRGFINGATVEAHPDTLTIEEDG